MQQLDDSRYELDLGPGMGVATLQEIDDQALITERNNDIKNLLGDLEGLRDIMLDFNIITVEQGEQLRNVETNVSSAKVNTEVGNQELVHAYNYNVDIYKKRQGFMRVVAILGGGGIGTAGFLVNPLVGVGTMIAGGGLGWLITRGKTVDKILTVLPDTEKTT